MTLDEINQCIRGIEAKMDVYRVEMNRLSRELSQLTHARLEAEAAFAPEGRMAG